MDLLVVQLKAAIRRLLDGKGVRARVLDKVNRYGEVVIGVILERPTARTPQALTAEAAACEPAEPRHEGAAEGTATARERDERSRAKRSPGG